MGRVRRPDDEVIDAGGRELSEYRVAGHEAPARQRDAGEVDARRLRRVGHIGDALRPEIDAICPTPSSRICFCICSR